MFSSSCNYPKLKTNLSLCNHRLDVVMKKKKAVNLNTRKDVADLLEKNKVESARIKVEQVIRDDYVVEAMELLQQLIQILHVRFGLLQSAKTIDPGLDTAIATIIWCNHRLSNEINELKEVCKQLTLKYGKEHTAACQQNTVKNVKQNVISKLSVNAPDPILVEDYLCEIAKSYNIAYERDPMLLRARTRTDSEIAREGDALIDIDLPSLPGTTENRRVLVPGTVLGPADNGIPPPPSTSVAGGGGLPYPTSSSFPAFYPTSLHTNTDKDTDDMHGPPPYEAPPYDHLPSVPPSGGQQPYPPANDDEFLLPDLPDAPGRNGEHDTGSNTGEDVNFDELTKRFENLRKKTGG